MLKDIPLERLTGPKTLLRPVLTDEIAYRELVTSIRKDGICQSLLVRPVGDKYEVVEGNHRYTAARELGLKTVPCIVKELTDEQVRVMQVSLQAIRLEAQPMEYCARIQQLIENGTTMQEMCALTGKRTEWLQDILKLRRVTKDARDLINNGEIPLRSAVALARLPISLQREYLNEAVALPTTQFVERVRQILKHYRQGVNVRSLEDRFVTQEVRPYLRTMQEIRHEVATFESAGVHLKLENAQTPLDGWKACVKWLLHVDPISLDQHEHKCKSAKLEVMNYYERRRRDRKLRDQLLGENNEQRTCNPES